MKIQLIQSDKNPVFVSTIVEDEAVGLDMWVPHEIPIHSSIVIRRVTFKIRCNSAGAYIFASRMSIGNEKILIVPQSNLTSPPGNLTSYMVSSRNAYYSVEMLGSNDFLYTHGLPEMPLARYDIDNGVTIDTYLSPGSAQPGVLSIYLAWSWK